MGIIKLKNEIKGEYNMRPRSLNFEQLVDMNRQELLNDEKSISQIEEKLEKKQEAFLLNHKKNNKELTAE